MKISFLIAALLSASSLTFSQVTVTAPTNNSTVPSPVQFIASAQSTNGSAITAMQIYVDNNSVYSTPNASLNTAIPLAAGPHAAVVKAWDATGKIYYGPVQFTVATVGPNVVITSPQNNSTVNSPVQVISQSHSDSLAQITGTRVYVDGVDVFHSPNGTVNTPVTMSPGPHVLLVKSWDSVGKTYSASVNVTVNGGSGIPPNAKLFDNIDQMTGWQNCDVCAGPNGHGVPTPHTLTQYVASPSLDGQSAQFWIGGSHPYGAALWWKQLGAQPTAGNFVYDTYFYSDNTAAAQALEFDVNQAVGGLRYVFGTECNIRGSRQWDVWDGKHWSPTGIACTVPTPFTWHHLVWQFQRAGNNVVYISVTLDGNTSYLNRSYAAKPSGTKELNVAFQLDGNSRETNYTFWLDKVKLYYW